MRTKGTGQERRRLHPGRGMKAVTTCARSSDEVLVSKVFGLNFGEAIIQ